MRKWRVTFIIQIVPLDFQFLTENLLKCQICFNPFNNFRKYRDSSAYRRDR